MAISTSTMGSTNAKRRTLLAGMSSALLLAPAFSTKTASLPRVEVWKSPSCLCCNDWVIHLRQHGFSVVTHDVGNNAKRAQLNVPNSLGSCHTAVVDGYAIEGHVPASEILRLLRERPKAIGLAVPGMPLGSPGMDGEKYDFRTQPYQVLLLHEDQRTSVFQSYN
jgi:hypothetical protein